jgi:hypothetical protein
MFEITLTKNGPVPSLLKRELNNCHRDAMAWAGRYWDQQFRELHFSNAATRRYGYAPRQGETGRPARRFEKSYTGKKLRLHGHTRPLEWSGESRRRTRNPRVVATAKKGEAKVRVIMNSPGFNRRYAGSSINMRDELTRVIPSEGQAIGQQISKVCQKRYQISARSVKRF